MIIFMFSKFYELNFYTILTNHFKLISFQIFEVLEVCKKALQILICKIYDLKYLKNDVNHK